MFAVLTLVGGKVVSRSLYDDIFEEGASVQGR